MGLYQQFNLIAFILFIILKYFSFYFHFVYSILAVVIDEFVCRISLRLVNAKMPRKLKILTVGEKQSVDAVKCGRKKKNLAEDFGIPASTIFTIKKK